MTEPLLQSSIVTSNESAGSQSQSVSASSTVASNSFLPSSNNSPNVALEPTSQTSSISSIYLELESSLSFINSFLESTSVSQCDGCSSDLSSETPSQSNIFSLKVTSGTLSPSITSSNANSEPLSPSSSVPLKVVPATLSQSRRNSSNMVSEPLLQSRKNYSNMMSETLSPSSSGPLNEVSESQSQLNSVSANATSGPLSHSSTQFSNVMEMNVQRAQHGPSSPLTGRGNVEQQQQQQQQNVDAPRTAASFKKRLKQRVKEEFSVPHSCCNNLNIRTLKMDSRHKYSIRGVKKCSFGNQRSGYSTKVFLFVGERGSGKTTMINAIVNSLFDINLDDDFRLRVPVAEDESHTSYVTEYVLYYTSGMRYNYNVILIDTPSFGNSNSIISNREIMEMIEAFLQDSSVWEVHNVFIVVPVSTTTRTCVLDCIMSVFGKDIAQVSSVMVSFAESEDDAKIVFEVMDECGVTFPRKYFLDNSSLYTENLCTEPDEKNKGTWKNRCDVIDNIIRDTSRIAPVTIELTLGVRCEKSGLQSGITDLLRYVCPCSTFTLTPDIRLEKIIAYLQRFVIVDSGPSKEISKDTPRQWTEKNIFLRKITTKYCRSFHAKEKAGKAIDPKLIHDSLATINNCMQRLEQISLKVDPLLRSSHIEEIINKEERERLTDFENRIQLLKEQQIRAKIVEGVLFILNPQESNSFFDNLEDPDIKRRRKKSFLHLTS